MTIIEKETNLRESRVLQSIRIPDANAEEDLRVLYQIFDPPEEACESCQYPVLVAVDIDIFGGVRMGGLAILDTAKLGSASNDGLMSTNNLVSDSSSWAYYLAAMFFRFGNPTKTSDPASHMKKLIPSGRRVILVQNGLGLPDWWETLDHGKFSYCLNTTQLTRRICCPLGSLSELRPHLDEARPRLPTAIGDAGNNANTIRLELLEQAALFPGYTPEKSPAEAAMLKKELDQGLLAEERERKAKKRAERSRNIQKIFEEMRRELVTLRSGVDQVGTDLALLLQQHNIGPEPYDLMYE